MLNRRLSTWHAHIKLNSKWRPQLRPWACTTDRISNVKVMLVENCDIMDLHVTKWSGFMCQPRDKSREHQVSLAEQERKSSILPSSGSGCRWIIFEGINMHTCREMQQIRRKISSHVLGLSMLAGVGLV